MTKRMFVSCRADTLCKLDLFVLLERLFAGEGPKVGYPKKHGTIWRWQAALKSAGCTLSDAPCVLGRGGDRPSRKASLSLRIVASECSPMEWLAEVAFVGLAPSLLWQSDEQVRFCKRSRNCTYRIRPVGLEKLRANAAVSLAVGSHFHHCPARWALMASRRRAGIGMNPRALIGPACPGECGKPELERGGRITSSSASVVQAAIHSRTLECFKAVRRMHAEAIDTRLKADWIRPAADRSPDKCR